MAVSYSHNTQLTSHQSYHEDELHTKLKELLIEELNLVDVTVDEIENDTPLFGEGLGLDSLDAVEIVVLVQKNFGVEIKNMDEGKTAFQSVGSLADFIKKRQV
ncbi:phosphopantetheine-binding protein [Maridesulfovibrio hydrothermalis]|uniref:phosphopantetheine-binding protein n=1 Tax=Maridesulfovibrio hydrothermalis TaxID=191026 RepID=UPI0009DA07AC|nr:phosphopantetheine-binding protein [Maridesulfovibrio hydrothermalis]